MIEDLLWSVPNSSHALGQPEVNPLRDADGLQEAQLLDVRIDAVRLTAGLLFDLRLALQLRRGNTGVLVAHGVRELAWLAGPRSTARTAWTVGESVPRDEYGLFRLRLGMWPPPGAELSLLAESAAFHVGDVRGLDRVPSYVDDDDATIRAQVAGWRSDFTPIHAAFLGPTDQPGEPRVP